MFRQSYRVTFSVLVVLLAASLFGIVHAEGFAISPDWSFPSGASPTVSPTVNPTVAATDLPTNSPIPTGIPVGSVDPTINVIPSTAPIPELSSVGLGITLFGAFLFIVTILKVRGKKHEVTQTK
jgi:hypothetical protein